MNTKTAKRLIWIIGIPVIYAIILRFIFGINSWSNIYSVMNNSFLLCLPTITGILTMFFSKEAQVKKLNYRFFMPWVPILIFFVLTLLLAWEGWACWLMVLPVFLIAASIGGFIGAYIKLRKKNKIYLSFLMLFPFFMSPIEQMIGSIPATYEAYTYIDIQSDAEKIWKNVTNVSAIPIEQDKGWLTRSLGFPRPVKAELDFNGIGGYREAIFTNGLVFHETVTEYKDQEKMVFTIKANPHEIPSTTLDEHIVIGGKYFDVLNGIYRLEKLNSHTYRLHLSSHFQLSTTFNAYAGLWAKWIMKDIQNNILQVQKYRAENGN